MYRGLCIYTTTHKTQKLLLLLTRDFPSFVFISNKKNGTTKFCLLSRFTEGNGLHSVLVREGFHSSRRRLYSPPPDRTENLARGLCIYRKRAFRFCLGVWNSQILIGDFRYFIWPLPFTGLCTKGLKGMFGEPVVELFDLFWRQLQALSTLSCGVYADDLLSRWRALRGFRKTLKENHELPL